jgi:tetratricopeptide (TPR) repeat protein
LFRRLGVFVGGATLETVETVCDADLDTLASLVDKSLVRVRDGERYWMLETIREYATERLDASDEAAEFRRRHAEYFLALAEEAEPHLPADRREWVDRLTHEHDNLRAGLDWFEAVDETQLGLRLAGALSRFWFMKGFLAEGWRRLDGALSADERPTAARAKALNGAAFVATDSDATRRYGEEGLALHRQLGDAWGIAHSQYLLAAAAAEQGDMQEAQRLCEESARAFTKLGDEHYALMASGNLAWTYINLGDRERGVALNEDVLRRARAVSNERLEALSLGSAASFAIEDGRIDEAVSILKESHRLHTEINEPFQTACDVCRFAFALMSRGDAVTAARLFSCARALAEEIGASLRSWDPPFIDMLLESIRSQLDESAFAEAWEQGCALTADEAITLALDSLD